MGAEYPILRFWPGKTIGGGRLPALHRDVRDPSTVSVHGNEIRGRIGLTRAQVEVPEGSPLRALGFGPPLLGVCGKDAEALFGGAPFLPQHGLTVSTAAAKLPTS